MRSANFDSPRLTFQRLMPHQMIRAALINGLSQQNPYSDYYRRLVKELINPLKEGKTGFELEKHISACGDILGEHSRTTKQQKYLDSLLMDFSFISDMWEDIPYKELEQVQIIKKVDSLSALVQAVKIGNINQVYEIPEDMFPPDRDFLKHVTLTNRLDLLSRENISAFARANGIDLPDKFLEHGYISNDFWVELNERGFAYKAALTNAIGVLKNNYPYKLISAISHRNPTTGDQIRGSLHDVIEGFERFVHRHKVGDEIVFGLEAGKYEGTEFAYVPKRIPTRLHGDFDTVELHYMPDFLSDSSSLTWLHTMPYCNCPYSLNLRNHNEQTQQAKRIVYNWCPHSIDTVLEIIHKQKGVRGFALPENFVPIPAKLLIKFSDYLRYNCYVKTENQRRPLRETEIELTLFEFAKTKHFDWLFHSENTMPEYLDRLSYALRPLYFTQDRLD
ncbi:MAG: hypothetical protein MAG795_01070 [Candidatus Woesearchaeota archaeon]|nr:hypothetical protein [Candidatus Woesearchaeota archaeon]